MCDITSLSIRQFAAKSHTKDAIRKLIYSYFYFPFEAAGSVTSQHASIELLLREEAKGSDNGAAYLIDQRAGWDTNDKRIANWIRKARNKVLHEGAFPPEDEDCVISILRKGIALIGSLWVDQGFTLSKHFSSFECSLLEGKESGWEDKSDAYSYAAVFYCDTDVKKAIDIANKAFEMAVRGLAQGWKIKEADRLPLRELIERMEELDEDSAHPSLYYDKNSHESDLKVFGEEDIDWFYPPMTLSEIQEASYNRWDTERAAWHYTYEIRDAVLSYAVRIPYLDFAHCLKESWTQITKRLREVSPEVKFPEVDTDYWKAFYYYPGSLLRIPFRGPTSFLVGDPPSQYWKGDDLVKFVGVVSHFAVEFHLTLSF